MSMKTIKASALMGGSNSGKYSNLNTASVLKRDAGEDDHASAPVPLTTAEATTVEPMSIESADFVKGTVQEPAFRDKWFAVVFLAQLGIIIAVAVMYATGMLKTVGDFNNGPTRRALHRVLQAASSASNANSLQDNSNKNNYWKGGEQDDPTNTTYYNPPTSSSTDDISQNLDDFSQTLEAFTQTMDDDFSQTLDDIIYTLEEDLFMDIPAEDEIRFLSTFLVSVIVAPILSSVALGYMVKYARQLIQFSLTFAIGLNVVLALLAIFLAKIPLLAILPGFFAAILACYARMVWHRIPFATANVKAAVTCVLSNWGTALLGLANIPLFIGWTVIWGYVAIEASDSPWMQSQEYDIEVTDDAFGVPMTYDEQRMTFAGAMTYFALLLSFFWTWQVLKNVVHTTIAGTVGTWWFMPEEAAGYCSQGLKDSLCRSVTYSLGSICFGSLLVAIIEVIRSMLRGAASNRRVGILSCIAQCLMWWVERIARYFNKWAFIYVGLYGYSYIDAGRNVISLFDHRGWTTLINDLLVNRMLGMVCLCIGLINSLVAIVLTSLGNDGNGVIIGASAFVAFVLGILLSSIVFGVVLSAVDSIIVLFAESPAEGEANHPLLARELQDTWAQAWPDVFTPTATATAIPMSVRMV